MLLSLHQNTSNFLKHETRWLIRIIQNDCIGIHVVNNRNGHHFCRGRRGNLSRFDVDKSYLRWYYSAQEIEETKTEEKLGQSSNFHIWPRVKRKGQVTAALIAN